ncbi:MAG: hypothetical protein JNM45_10805 [Rhizobiales bacterium]|nr:hypothetical protein [Hyphomicrobiales bacterium]
MSLAFLQDRIESAINRQLSGLTISLSDTVLELDAESFVPHVRARNLVLTDTDGTILASAPKAGVTLRGASLLLAQVTVDSLELIGPRVNGRRNLDGSVQLGIVSSAASADEVTVVNGNDFQAVEEEAAAPKSAMEQQASPGTGGQRILDVLGARGNGGALANLDDIKITRAEVSFYDEGNDATWFSPRTDMTFRRTAYGFVVVAKAEVASGGDPWHAEVSASFKADTDTFSITATVADLVPANVADEVYALSQFAKLRMPFSGHFELEISASGGLNRADGELLASAGEINLPDYFAKPILVDEGSLRISYKAAEDVVKIVDSSILVGGSRAELTGALVPRRTGGKLTAVGIDLLARNISVDAQGTVKDPVDVDRIEFKGEASMEDQRVDISDLVVMAGNTGVRLRGIIKGGDESPGIQVAGRLRDVSAELLKKLWPPIMTPRTRTWITENIVDGRISEGTFQVNFPVNSLARALRDRILPPNVVDLSFSMENVTTHYFKTLPVLTGAAGYAKLKDDHFELNITSGQAALDTGATLRLEAGHFDATDLLSKEVPGSFRFDIRGPLENVIAFARHPDLNVITPDMDEAGRMRGNAQAIVELRLPLIKDVPKERVKATTSIAISNATYDNAMPGINLTEGQFNVVMDPQQITVTGPAKLNGISSQMNWQKPRGKGTPTVDVQTVVDAKMREKLGVKVADYMSGNVPVKIRVKGSGATGHTIDVAANLDDVALKLSAARWSRSKKPGTKASFTLVDGEKGTRLIKDLKLDGPGLRVRGNIEVTKAGELRSAKLSEIRLDEEDVFAVTLTPGDDVMNLAVSGSTFDARPYIQNLISPAKTAEAAAASQPQGQNFNVQADFASVTAHRGEVIRGVKANFVTRRGTITSATIDGAFENGLPLSIKVVPVEGGRELRVTSNDGGSTLRATNFYSKIAGGALNFYALIANSPGSPIRNGQLILKKFEVRNEATLAELDRRGRPKKSGPRAEGVTFKKLSLPFSTDAQFVRMCNVTLEGPDLGGVAEGLVRKADGAIDITGTMVPAQGLNGFLDDVPLFGQILTGGKGGGIFGVTFAMGGTISTPRTQVNPLSVLAPGILREMFAYKGTCAPRRSNLKPVGREANN